MADTYKVLAQVLTEELRLDNNTSREVVVYEVPSATQAVGSLISITNTGTTSTQYNLSFVPSAEVTLSYASVNYNTGYVGVYTAVSEDDSVGSYSTDGVTWTQTALPISSRWLATAYGNGKFVVVGSSNVAAYSIDGITWTQTVMPTSASSYWTDVAFGANTFVALARNSGASDAAAYSTDGVTWVATTLPSSVDFWKSVTYGLDKFVVIAYGSDLVAYSADGITWTEVALPTTGAGWRQVAYGGGKFVAVQQFSNQVVYSTDGITWTLGDPALPNSSPWEVVVYGNGKFVALSDNSVGAYSADGIAWTQIDMPASGVWRSITYGNNKFVAIGGGGALFSNVAAYSSDGITWTQVALPAVKVWTDVLYAEINTLQTNQQLIPQSLNKHMAVYDKTILPAETHEIRGGITLSSGDQIRVYSPSNEVTVNVYGVEIA